MAASRMVSYQLTYNPKGRIPVACLFCAFLPILDKKAYKLEVLSNGTDIEHAALLTSRPPDSEEAPVKGGDLSVARLIARHIPGLQRSAHSPASAYFGGPQQFQAEVDEWIDLAHTLDVTDSEGATEKSSLLQLRSLVKKIDKYLELRTFLVGHQLSLADIALYASLGKGIGFDAGHIDAPSQSNESLLLLGGTHLMRWWRLIHGLNPIPFKTMKHVKEAYARYALPQKACENASAQAKKRQPQEPASKTAGAVRSGESYKEKLPGAVEGQVVTRFSPEPSGYLHIGHAKAALLSAYYAKAYNGKFLIRFDDTNPSREKGTYAESILEDLTLLDIDVKTVTHTSDYFELLEALCEKMIKQGYFYVDSTPVEEMRRQRGEGIESACRTAPLQEHLRLWEEMKKGSAEGITCCVRAKMDMQAKNKCLRDPVMYRCEVNVPHIVHGTKYKVYPTYDFACPVVDSIEGVTHAMRANEYSDRIPQYQWVLQHCGLREVKIYEFSRLNFVNTVLSKRKLQWIVDTGIVESWADPRFPTVRGILRRGLTTQALMEFILEQGPSKNSNLMEWDKLWAKNKQILDPIVPRYMAVGEDAVVVKLLNGPACPEKKERVLHPKNPSVGTAVMIHSSCILLDRDDADLLEDGEELERNTEGKLISIMMRLNPEGDFKKTKKKVHWLAKTETKECRSSIPVVLREYDHLITKKKPEDEDSIADLCNKDSVFDTLALADAAIGVLEEGQSVQFERRGYFRLDKKSTTLDDASRYVFIKIPDGKTKAVSVVKTKVDAEKLTKGT